MRQTDLYLIRHGQTATNRAHLIQGWNSEPLNARGRWQAECAGKRLAQVGLQALYASPLNRARTPIPAAHWTFGPSPEKFPQGLGRPAEYSPCKEE